tara:strand:- start:130 stop:681 length:552 start_codon:yes stop_codon:yes gene_type:complete
MLFTDGVFPADGTSVPHGTRGGIIQIAYTRVNGVSSCNPSSGSLTNMSAFDTVITPRDSSNTFIIQLFLGAVSANGGNSWLCEIRRNNSSIDNLRGNAVSSRPRGTMRGSCRWNGDSNHAHSYMLQVEDQPNTTSQITYKAFFAAESNPNTLWVNRQHSSGGDGNYYGSRVMSAMTVMEVSKA